MAGHKDRPWSKKMPASSGKWDYIVIGSGMGGMTAAALLAKLGRRVLVLEQHYVAGGFTHTFSRPGYEWDVGVHAVGEVTPHSMTGRLLSNLTNGKLKWASLGPVYDEFYFPDDFRIDFPDSPGQFRDNLSNAFPGQTEAIGAYLNLVREVASSMRGYYLARALPGGLARPIDALLARKAQHYLSRTTREIVQDLTDDERLRSVFTAQWGYYGSPPSRSSFAMQALVVKHFLHGGFYPVGGSSQIAKTLLQTVADAGGWTRIRADVEQILVSGGRAYGVRLKGGEEILATKIISAAGIMSTTLRLLSEANDTDVSTCADTLNNLRPASAHVCLYIGFKGDIKSAGAGAANKWFYNTWSCEEEEWDVAPDQELPSASVLYSSFPSLKDPEHDPGEEQRHTGEVVTFVPWDAFAPWSGSRWKNRGESYDAFKTRMQDKLLEDFLGHMPALRPMVDYVELSTPLSTEHFCRPMRGSIYGIEPTPTRFANPWLRARGPVKNLYFAGSELTTVGVIGAMMGGVLSAVAAEPWRGVPYIRAHALGRRR